MNKNLLTACFLILSLIVAGCRPEQPSVLAPTALPTTPPTSIPLPAITLTSTETATTAPLTGAPTHTPTPPAQRLAVIFDDDGSPDGTTALFYLLSLPEVDVKAANISYGEAHPAIYIQHIGRKLDDLGITDILLGAGQDAPLAGSNEFPEAVRQAANDFWGLPLPNADKTYPVQDAAELIVSVVNQNPEPVAIFVSGPCTNLAQALRLDPGIRENIAAVYIMGGAVYASGNIYDFLPESNNTVAEWNVYADPQAAKEVFESGLDIYLVPLDATNQVSITRDDTNQWRKGGRGADFAADIYDMLLDNWGVENAAIWDLMTAGIMVEPDLCGFKPLHLQVVTDQGATSGQTRVVEQGEPNVNVCLEPQAASIRQALIEGFSSAPAINPEQTVTLIPEPMLSITPTATPENLIFRDDFNGVLGPGWTWENERSSHWTITPDGWLQIRGGDAALLYGQTQSNLLWRELPSGDFAVTVHLQSAPVANFQQATIYLYEDLDNYIAINRGYCGFCVLGGNGIYMEYKINGKGNAYSVAFKETDLYIKLESKDNTISGFYATAPDQWKRLGGFGNYFLFNRVGLGVTNSDMKHEVNADLVGWFDYFEIARP